MRSIAIYLGLDADDLLKRHTHLYDRSVPTQTVMRSSMYSPLKDAPEGAIRCGEHCDWHTITLLFQDMVGGLEVSKFMVLRFELWIDVVLEILQTFECFNGSFSRSFKVSNKFSFSQS